MLLMSSQGISTLDIVVQIQSKRQFWIFYFFLFILFDLFDLFDLFFFWEELQRWKDWCDEFFEVLLINYSIVIKGAHLIYII